MAAERLRRVQARDAYRVVEDKRGSAGGGEGSTNDLHPFAAFVLFADFLSRELRAKSREAPPKDIISSPLGHCHCEITLIDPSAWGASIRTYSRSPVKSIVPVKKPSRSVGLSLASF